MPSLRVAVGAIGLAGHTLPALALSRELSRRGHEVRFFGFERWRSAAEGLGLRFEDGEHSIFGPGIDRPPRPADGARAFNLANRDFGPDVIVSDGLTLVPALAAEVAEIPHVTLLPEVYPVDAPGLPFFSLGLLAPRTALGAHAWRAAARTLTARLPTTAWLRWSSAALNEQRRELGLAPRTRFDTAERGLTIVATLPALEYPRVWPSRVHVTGPMVLDLEHRQTELPPGDEPLVVVAPSTVKDPEGRLVRLALQALAPEPLRIVVTTGGAQMKLDRRPPGNVVVADWIDYSQVLAKAAVVVCHGNHGTVAKSLLEGVPLVISPAMPDDAEHGARVTWAGAGVMVPRRLLASRSLRLAARQVLDQPRFSLRAGSIAAASPEGAGPVRAAELIEESIERGGG